MGGADRGFNGFMVGFDGFPRGTLGKWGSGGGYRIG